MSSRNSVMNAARRRCRWDCTATRAKARRSEACLSSLGMLWVSEQNLWYTASSRSACHELIGSVSVHAIDNELQIH